MRRTRAPRRTAAERSLPDDAELAARMTDVARYCIYDAEACQLLLRRKNVLAERREVAAMSFTSLFSSVYQADGGRVLNLMGAFEAALRVRDGLSPIFGTFARRKVDERYAETKFPGAWVFDVLCKDIERMRPVTGLDFSSLYPSLIMAYCFSPDRSLVGDRAGRTDDEIAAMEAAGAARAAQLTEAGYDVVPVQFPFSDLIVRDWFVRAAPGEDLNRRTGRGLYPAILIDLFARRKNLKKARLNPLAALIGLHNSATANEQAQYLPRRPPSHPTW